MIDNCSYRTAGTSGPFINTGVSFDASSMNLKEVMVALATSDRISNRSFSCGSQRCLSEVEYCYLPARTGPNAELDAPALCKPAPGGGEGCSLIESPGEACPCETDDRGNATVRCSP